MPTWEINKVDKSEINNGNEYEVGNALLAKDLNSIVKNSLWAVDQRENSETLNPIVTLAGSGNAFTASIPSINTQGNKVGTRFVAIMPSKPNSTTWTINLNNYGAKNVRIKYLNTSSTTTLSVSYIAAGVALPVIFDGTYWIIENYYYNSTTGVTSLNGSIGALNLKTINGNSLIGSGDITISGDSSGSGWASVVDTTSSYYNLYINSEAKFLIIADTVSSNTITFSVSINYYNTQILNMSGSAFVTVTEFYKNGEYTVRVTVDGNNGSTTVAETKYGDSALNTGSVYFYFSNISGGRLRIYKQNF